MRCTLGDGLSSRNSKGLSALHLVEEYPRSNPGVTVSSVQITRLEQRTDNWLVLFKPRRGLRKFIMLTIFGIRSAGLFADGFRLPDQDAFATARGEAFAATAGNASAIYYNPAGISHLKGWNFRGGIYGIYLPLSYQSPSGRTFDNEKTMQ